MNVTIFMSIWSSGVSATDLSGYFRGAPLDWLKLQQGIRTVEIYTPEPGDVPILDDVPAPAIIVQIDVEAEGAARQLVKNENFKQQFTNDKSAGEGIETIRLELTEAVHYPVGAETAPVPRTAPLSFVVRYYGPVVDPVQFVEFYTENHPQILARFPAIRNVLCYLPLGWRESGAIENDGLVIGNEVVFDDLDALKHSMTTPVQEEALEDSYQFQDFGYSTHHAMHRELVYSRE